MNNTSQHLNTTFQSVFFTNATAEVNSTKNKAVYDLYASLAKIIAYSTVYGIVSIIALAGTIHHSLLHFMNERDKGKRSHNVGE